MTQQSVSYSARNTQSEKKTAGGSNNALLQVPGSSGRADRGALWPILAGSVLQALRLAGNSSPGHGKTKTPRGVPPDFGECLNAYQLGRLTYRC